MFGQVLDKLDTFFGRHFLLARYVPWLLCAVANGFFAYLEFPSVRAFVAEAYADATGGALNLATALLVIAAAAYATSPLVQFVTRFLEGELMPAWLARLTILTHALRRDRLENNYRRESAMSATVPDSTEVVTALRADRAVGTRYRKIGNADAIAIAEDWIVRLRMARWLNRPIPREQFESARSALSRALRENCAEANLFLDAEKQLQAARLHELHDEMWRRLAPYALDRARQSEERALGERDRLFAEKELAATRLGNDAAALRSYCLTRYGIEFDMFWPRFLLVVQKDAKLSDAMATAKIQLDFSILALTLTTVTVIGWSLYLAFHGTSLWAALLVVGIGPLAAYSWLGIVHASYATFAEMVRSAIDLYRFNLLTAMRRRLPVSTDEELRCWSAVNRLVLLDEHRDNVTFKHLES